MRKADIVKPDGEAMASLKMTPTRLAVLRAIAAGEVSRHRGWTKSEKTRDIWSGNGGQNVTRTCNDLTNANPRLAVTGRSTGPSIYSPQVWELTEAGRKVLAEADAPKVLLDCGHSAVKQSDVASWCPKCKQHRCTADAPKEQ
ncbi:hypothetical protein E1211_17970 [Micromonospora sp. 15K316]|uniref:hypothetical protein n=1 Tax=Micromonospora sp. 15K316 TaxID=2530376 RepID=UPI001046E26A|nr:hypothetical protein [Micromonospora sp. 15K316]TDC34234.1 hypothetical protein E1211_17970 [Micromonospora sp. 15K316]